MVKQNRGEGNMTNKRFLGEGSFPKRSFVGSSPTGGAKMFDCAGKYFLS